MLLDFKKIDKLSFNGVKSFKNAFSIWLLRKRNTSYEGGYYKMHDEFKTSNS